MFKKKNKIVGKEISGPLSVSHGLHVDTNFEWSGPDAAKQFVFGEKLGEGSFGSVYRASHKSAKIEFAIKTIPVQDNDDLGDIEHEISILKKCSSPNIVSYYGCFRNGKDFWILMDFCVHGSLRDLMDHMDKPLEENVIANIMQGALAGLAYLHSKNIIHRDIKAANILLDGKGTPKLADFGVSCQMANTWAKTMVGTPLWMAPEVARMQTYSFSADVWSMGITAMELAQFYPPYADVSPMRALILITRNPPPKLGEGFSANFNDFMTKCLNKVPEGRPDAMTLLKHPFITKAPDCSDAMKQMLAFSDDYRDRAKKGQAPLTRSKRVPPTTPPPKEPPPGTKRDADPFGFDDEDDGTVVVKRSTRVIKDDSSDGTVVIRDGGADSGTVVVRDGGADSGTVVVRSPERSGTVVARTNRSAAAVGSWARVRAAMKRHVTIVSPTTPSAGSGLVSKRDFFFIIVGAVCYMMISHMIRSVLGSS